MMNSGLHLVVIGLVDICLALFLFHKAIPLVISGDHIVGESFKVLLHRLFSTIRNAKTIRAFICLPFLAVCSFRNALVIRARLLKIWTLGVALGLFGVRFTFSQSVISNPWFLIIGNYFLIIYVFFRFLQIRSRGDGNWWRN